MSTTTPTVPGKSCCRKLVASSSPACMFTHLSGTNDKYAFIQSQRVTPTWSYTYQETRIELAVQKSIARAPTSAAALSQGDTQWEVSSNSTPARPRALPT